MTSIDEGVAAEVRHRRLIVVAGPTGAGKTDLGVSLACHYGAPVLSTDSRQIYRGMAIGTAQPAPEQLAAAEHHFIAERDVDDDFSCGEFERCALARLDELFGRSSTVIAVGGSGLYIKALCEGMDELPDSDPVLRNRLSARLADEGLAALAAELREADPEYYAMVDASNPARVLRALEVCILSGGKFSAMRTGNRRKRDFEVVKIGVMLPREELYGRIDRRVDAMMAAGLEEEARALLPFRHCNALRTVGYSEMFDWFDGRISREEAVELIKRNSRRYAKRQLTWFRRDGQIRWFAPAPIGPVIEYIDSQFG